MREHCVPPTGAAAISIVLLLVLGALAIPIIADSVVGQWDAISVSIAAGFERGVEDAGAAVDFAPRTLDDVQDVAQSRRASVAHVLINNVVGPAP